MAFIYEKISDLDRAKYDLDKLEVGRPYSQKDWVIDRESNIWLRQVFSEREEPIYRWMLFRNDYLYEFTLRLIDVVREEGSINYKFLLTDIACIFKDRFVGIDFASSGINIVTIEEMISIYKDGSYSVRNKDSRLIFNVFISLGEV